METNNYGSQFLRGAALIAGLAAVLGNAVAGGVESAAQPFAQTQFRGHPITLYTAGPTVVANAATMDAFAAVVAPTLREFSATTDFEACASICRAIDDPTAWAVTPITIQSHISCPAMDSCPEGYEPTGFDIHSHPQLSRYKPNATDRLFLKNNRSQIAMNPHPDQFSEADYASPGYMVSKTKLRFQHGSYLSVRDVAESADAGDDLVANNISP
jgi:hypothetical protein